MLVGALISQIVAALVLASVTSTKGADATWLTIFGFTSGLAAAFIFVGLQMLIHGLTPSEYLERAVSLDSAVASLSRMGGPALGGVLLAVIGISPVFVIAAVCYLPLASVVAVIAAPIAPREPGPRPRLREAARLSLSEPLLRWALVTAALAETLALPLVTMMPAVTESLNRDAADRLGVLVACIAVGSVGQVFFLAKLRERHDARWIVGVGYGLAGCSSSGWPSTRNCSSLASC